jgi:hypothetical protein
MNRTRLSSIAKERTLRLSGHQDCSGCKKIAAEAEMALRLLVSSEIIRKEKQWKARTFADFAGNCEPPHTAHHGTHSQACGQEGNRMIVIVIYVLTP